MFLEELKGMLGMRKGNALKKILLSASKCHHRDFTSLLASTIGGDSYQVTGAGGIFRHLGKKNKANKKTHHNSSKKLPKGKTTPQNPVQVQISELLSTRKCRMKQKIPATPAKTYGMISGVIWPNPGPQCHHSTFRLTLP